MDCGRKDMFLNNLVNQMYEKLKKFILFREERHYRRNVILKTVGLMDSQEHIHVKIPHLLKSKASVHTIEDSYIEKAKQKKKKIGFQYKSEIDKLIQESLFKNFPD